MRIVPVVVIGVIAAVFSPHIEAKQQKERADTRIERGLDDCHHAVYGRVAKSPPGGEGVQEELVTVGTVEMDRQAILRNIRFDRSTNEFVIKYSGTYRINYFLKALSEHTSASALFAMKGGQPGDNALDIAVSINGKLRGVRSFMPLLAQEGFISFSGANTLLAILRKGDRVKLVVDKLPRDNVPVSFLNTGNKEGERKPLAYLAIAKTERND